MLRPEFTGQIPNLGKTLVVFLISEDGIRRDGCNLSKYSFDVKVYSFEGTFSTVHSVRDRKLENEIVSSWTSLRICLGVR